MKVSLIAAVAENGVIGLHNKLPWRIKSEFKYFVATTKGKPVIMGRKTFESLDGPLKDRANIVITRDKNYSRPGVIVTDSLEKALDAARKAAAERGTDEIMVIGGAEIYRLALPLADRLYLTTIHMKPEGDSFFPDFDKNIWKEKKAEFHKALPGESADYTIRVLEKG